MSAIDPDDLFLQIVEGVDIEEPTDVVDYTKLDDIEISQAYQAVRKELHELGQMYNWNPVGRAAELHAQFAAINAEMRRRWPPL